MNKRLLDVDEVIEVMEFSPTAFYACPKCSTALIEAQDAKTLKEVGGWLEKRIVGGTENTLALKGWDKSIFEQGRMPE